ncbi:hypothetical protein ILYODFUR_021660 [Ilyodon furcidens]|uniref:Uncharacterized protein n=1 Tax=Ilyodon furcidens TaxID=33524 RepID=A0ABV0V788_9TELE
MTSLYNCLRHQENHCTGDEKEGAGIPGENPHMHRENMTRSRTQDLLAARKHCYQLHTRTAKILKLSVKISPLKILKKTKRCPYASATRAHGSSVLLYQPTFSLLKLEIVSALSLLVQVIGLWASYQQQGENFLLKSPPHLSRKFCST